MRILIPASCLAGLGLGALLWDAAPGAWVLPTAFRWVLFALLIGTIGVLAVWRRGRGVVSWFGVCLLFLAAASGLPLLTSDPDPDDWRVQEEARFQRSFDDVRGSILALETTARSIGDEALALLGDSVASRSRTVEERARLFEALDRLLQRHRLPPASGPAGVQLSTPGGELLAWAGTPHPQATSTRLTRLAGGTHALYFRQSGVYTLLSYEGRPDTLVSTSNGVRALVDVPIEVHYQLNNRFLPSRSLTEGLSTSDIEVEFDYDAAFLPTYLTKVDLDLRGDPHTGLQGEAVVRDSEGVALVLCRLSGTPYSKQRAEAAAGVDRRVRWLLILATAAGAVAFGRALRSLVPVGAGRVFFNSSWIVVWIWGVRMLLAWLELPSSQLGSPMQSPATFAITGWGGILRTPLDLLLTSLVLASTAGVVFLESVRRAVKSQEPKTSTGPAWLRWIRPFAAAFLVGVVVVAAFDFVGRVAGNSNPHLAGPELDLLSRAVLCIHLALLAGVASWLALAMLAVSGIRGPTRRGWVGWILAAGLLGVGLWIQASPVTAFVGLLVLGFGAGIRALLTDRRFTSFGLASFALVGLAATLNSDAIHGEDQRNKQALVRERASEILEPGDDVRRFVLDEVLDQIQSEPGLVARIRTPGVTSLAFRTWARSMLSQLGYSCQVRVYDTFGLLVSEFAVDMPVGNDVSPRPLLDRVSREGRVTTEVEIETAASGRVRLYRGAVSVSEPASGVPTSFVVVDLPFAHESLAFAANPRARAPDLLQDLQEEGVGPRVEESDRLLLAWLEGEFVVESSTPYLEVGPVPSVVRSGQDAWQRLPLLSGTYLVTRAEAGEHVLLAGFRLATPLDRLLEWAQVGSFSFGATFLFLLSFLGIGRLGLARRRLPPLLVPKRLGFQQKLMMAFLVVALLPSVVLSVATRDIMQDRRLRRNRDVALAKARSAEEAFADLVRRDLDAVRESEYLRAVLSEQEAPPARDIGHLEFSQIMVFRGDGSIVLDETLSNLTDEQARAFVGLAPRRLFASRDGRHLYLGALVKIWYSPTEGLDDSAPDAEPYYMHYRRRLTDSLLRNLAPILNTDISGFLGGALSVSSQKSMATAGLLPSIVPAPAFVNVQLRRNPYAVFEEKTGRRRYFAGYLPLEDAFGNRLGALGVSQLLQPDEFAIEVERTHALVLGLSTLMFVLTLLLGVLFASRIFDPVRNLIEGTRRIAGGDLGFRLRARSTDEIGELERSFNDMAARLQEARGALEERRRDLEAVLGNIASGVLATGADGRITAANPAAYRILRLEPGSLEGRSWSELAQARSDTTMGRFWSRLGEAQDGEVFEVPVLRSERVTLRVIVTELLAEDETARTLGHVAIFEDVTELIRSKKLAAWAEMARQVAHEIKNPLAPMKLSAQFMEEAYLDGSDKFPQIFREGMTTIVEQVDALRRIATEFSNFGRVQKLEPRPIDLGKLVQSATAPYRRIEGLVFDALEGSETSEAMGHGVRVLGDEDGLRKVFTNVLENAREAMNGRGRITLRVLPPDAGHVEIRVTDQGQGLSDEAAARLFEPYFSTKSTGTGLGLAISRGILEELGGTIDLVNLPQGGVEARITLATY